MTARSRALLVLAAALAAPIAASACSGASSSSGAQSGSPSGSQDASSPNPPSGDGASPADGSPTKRPSQGDAAPPPVPTDAATLGDASGPHTFTVTNRCTQTIWAAALPKSTFPNDGIVEMAPGYAFQVSVDNGWSGRIWGKVSCTTTGGALTCASDPFPSSLAELTLTKTPDAGGQDFYDVSLVDGFNLPIELAAVGHTPDPAHPYACGNPSCVQNLNTTCPAVLQDMANGQVLACANDECKVLGESDAASPDCVYPNSYTEFFKDACPTAYSYPYDDPTSTFTCKGVNDYAVTFCP